MYPIFKSLDHQTKKQLENDFYNKKKEIKNWKQENWKHKNWKHENWKQDNWKQENWKWKREN